MKVQLKKLTYSAMSLALCMVLPFVTGQIPQIGSMLLPMHLPVLLCGFLCGWPYGLAVGLIAPLLRHAIFTMPPLMTAIPMAFELAAYGALTGLFYHLFPKKIGFLYVDLVAAMLGGRVVWAVVRYIMMGLGGSEFSLAVFWASGFAEAVPGMILQLVLIPILVAALRRAKLVPNE